MKTGFRGTFVISWSQTELDGQKAAPIGTLCVGAAWSWAGDALRVDGPANVLQLDRAEEDDNLRRRAAKSVRRLVGVAIEQDTSCGGEAVPYDVDDPLLDQCFVISDGRDSYVVTLIETGTGSNPLLMFHDCLPPTGKEFWVVHYNLDTPTAKPSARNEGGVICFTPGTRIMTPVGPRNVEHLREGDKVLTRDSGPQEVQWTGARRMSGARLFVMPQLRPIRFRAGALAVERPDQELLVSPSHRMLVTGPVARTLFNTDEVLVAARDLVNGSTVTVDMTLREVTYVHLLLPNHEVIWANGVETESFHPASADLASLDDNDRDRLMRCLPGLAVDPYNYGAYARRNLSNSEAAILLHDAA
jgi:hypothetical protein